MMIWLSFLLGIGISHWSELQTIDVLSVIVGLFNLTAIAAGILLLALVAYHKKFFIPLAVYTVGFLLCWTFLVH